MQLLKKLIISLCGIGLAISIYLLYSKVFGSEIVCGVSSCGIVNGSKYAEILGVPVSALGVLFYISMGVLLFLDFKRLFFIGSICGLLFSGYLTYMEAFVIHAWCQWCIMSAWICVCLFVYGMRVALFTGVTPVKRATLL